MGLASLRKDLESLLTPSTCEDSESASALILDFLGFRTGSNVCGFLLQQPE